MNIEVAHHMYFTSVSRCDVEITPCFTIPTAVRTSNGAPKVTLNETWDPKRPKRVLGAQVAQKGWRFETQNQQKKSVGFRSWKSRPRGRPRLANGILGTSKVKEFLRRGCIFQFFTRFRHKAIFDKYSTPKLLIWGMFWDSF